MAMIQDRAKEISYNEAVEVDEYEVAQRAAERPSTPMWERQLPKSLPQKKINAPKMPSMQMPTMPTLSLPVNHSVINLNNLSRGNTSGLSRSFNLAIGKKNDSKVNGLALRRIRQQKGLNPWGDFDGDGVINMLDCNPRNKFKQGPMHTVEDKLNPSDDLRDNPDDESLISKELKSRPKEEQKNKIVNTRQMLLNKIFGAIPSSQSVKEGNKAIAETFREIRPRSQSKKKGYYVNQYVRRPSHERFYQAISPPAQRRKVSSSPDAIQRNFGFKLGGNNSSQRLARKLKPVSGSGISRLSKKLKASNTRFKGMKKKK